jgi:hypothetical protein
MVIVSPIQLFETRSFHRPISLFCHCIDLLLDLSGLLLHVLARDISYRAASASDKCDISLVAV